MVGPDGTIMVQFPPDIFICMGFCKHVARCESSVSVRMVSVSRLQKGRSGVLGVKDTNTCVLSFLQNIGCMC